MNSDKLVKAIQILIKEELKQVLPKLIKETVKKEVSKTINELTQTETKQKSEKSFLDEDVISENPTKALSKNPILNEVLSQTKPFSPKQRSDDGGFRTMNFDKSDVHTLGQRNIVEKQGLGVQTGNETLDKALNRDYSDLMKAIDKKRGKKQWQLKLDKKV